MGEWSISRERKVDFQAIQREDRAEEENEDIGKKSLLSATE
jgi:hypothetical protein